jgi:hypothetical protein
LSGSATTGKWPVVAIPLAAARSYRRKVIEEPRSPAGLDTGAILAETDLTLRNLYITDRYHTLSERLRSTVSVDDANWSTFATWASKTVGQTVRSEDIPAVVREVVDAADDLLQLLDHVNRMLPLVPDITPERLLAPMYATLRDVSGHVSEGNLKVFAELAPLFDAFADRFGHDTAYDDAALAPFLSGLAPGPADEGGQELLRKAFTAYYRARHTKDPQVRARLVLLGNCQIGLHEQMRLQPQIAAAMNTPVADLVVETTRDTVRRLLPDWIEDEVDQAFAAPLQRLAEALEPLWCRVITRHLMELAQPGGGELPLGVDQPVVSLPEALRLIDDPEELRIFWTTYDVPSAQTGARDWTSLADRMNYIINLFRTRQRDVDLFTPPFTRLQRDDLYERRMPVGRL